jgi:glycosyltransferase involved in cell wall biosynthesis
MRKATFTGALTGRDLSRAFANMDIFAFPSETDTFGLVILEAMASGVPAVVTARGGPRFSVQHGETGFVAEDFDDFVACTEKLLTQPDLLSSMRRAARQHALSSSWEEIFDGMYAIYEGCLRPADPLCPAGPANAPEEEPQAEPSAKSLTS